MEFRYDLIGTGWAKAHLSHGESSVVLTASYLSDALGNLLEAVGALLDGAHETRVSWDEEPGEFRWIFRREGDVVDLTVVAFPELWGAQPDAVGDVVFAARADLRDVAAAIESGAAQVLAEHGAAEYEVRWVDAPFPTAALEKVRDHLAQQARPAAD